MSKRFLICVHLQGAPFVQAQRTPEIPIEINEDDKKADFQTQFQMLKISESFWTLVKTTYIGV